jgi:hypothetical protein
MPSTDTGESVRRLSSRVQLLAGDPGSEECRTYSRTRRWLIPRPSGMKTGSLLSSLPAFRARDCVELRNRGPGPIRDEEEWQALSSVTLVQPNPTSCGDGDPSPRVSMSDRCRPCRGRARQACGSWCPTALPTTFNSTRPTRIRRTLASVSGRCRAECRWSENVCFRKAVSFRRQSANWLRYYGSIVGQSGDRFTMITGNSNPTIRHVAKWANR